MIKDCTLALLVMSQLKKDKWGDALLCEVVNWNATAGSNKSPFELITGRSPDLSTLKLFGCRIYVRIPNDLQNHMELRVEAGIFIRYSPETKGYKIVKDGQAKNFFIRAPRDCTFKEDIFPGDAKQTEQESKEE